MSYIPGKKQLVYFHIKNLFLNSIEVVKDEEHEPFKIKTVMDKICVGPFVNLYPEILWFAYLSHLSIKILLFFV